MVFSFCVILTFRSGTDFLYSRFRPGLITTLVFLILFISGMQLTFHALTASRHRAHINRYIREAKEQAWRPSGGIPPLSGARKYVTLSDQTEEGAGPARKFVVDFDGSVFFIDGETGEESFLDVNEIEGANWRRTLIYVLPTTIWNATAGRLLQKKSVKETEDAIEQVESSGAEQSNGNTPGAQGKYSKAEKVGGRRKAKKRN
jgi:DnaJ family protein C protein 1